MMPRSHLDRLRRSALVAWLACLYALAVVASTMAPAPAAAEPFAGLLCSGQVAVPDGGDGSDDARDHCKPCLPLPGLALLPAAPAASPRAVTPPQPAVFAMVAAEPLPSRYGPAQARAPPPIS